MEHRLQAVAVLLLTAAAGLTAQNAKEPKAPPPARNELKARPGPRNPALKNPAPKDPVNPKGGGGQKLGAPGNPVERLMAMPPEKREQVLEKLPPQQQANLRERLDRFDKLPAAERARLNQMWNTFNALPPEKQALVKQQMQA